MNTDIRGNMLYHLAHILRDHFPFLWDWVSKLNSCLFTVRYGKGMKGIDSVLQKYSQNEFWVEALTLSNVEALALFFSEQPIESFDYFKPHDFDIQSLKKLAADKSFLAYVVWADHTIVGYFFLRGFFMGKCYRGYITDYRWRRKGINKLMGQCATDIAVLLNIPMFGTISPDNEASMKSAQAVNDVKIIETLKNGDYYVEYIPRNNHKNS